ncbi:MAG TPA: tRNA (N(6)-L-threonylcarbamoyladenosine(37)-C(2))-methylthiotransferase MtaB, partial [bacterium]|nr:tRNA (N(6)-L-threonylcarbamoyladenosine(37)-C(2))-methylthiotransferase MtaB [bacterium]
LTLDVMAGFPGEEESHFQNTVELLERVSPLKCHVFPYSRREGTLAARLENLDPAVVRDRVNRLILLGNHLGREVRQNYPGTVLPVLAEARA